MKREIRIFDKSRWEEAIFLIFRVIYPAFLLYAYPIYARWKCEFLKAGINKTGPNTASAGEIIATFDNPTKIWSELKIDGVPISQVLEESAIITWD